MSTTISTSTTPVTVTDNGSTVAVSVAPATVAVTAGVAGPQGATGATGATGPINPTTYALAHQFYA